MMLPATLVGAAILAASAFGRAEAAPDPLVRHRWSSRLVVVVAPAPGDPRVAEQKRILAEAGPGAGERDLALVEAVGDGPDASAIRRRLGVRATDFAAILVGKDGGAKLRSDRPLTAAALFEEIDTMPMRRSEMRKGVRP